MSNYTVYYDNKDGTYAIVDNNTTALVWIANPNIAPNYSDNIGGGEDIDDVTLKDMQTGIISPVGADLIGRTTEIAQWDTFNESINTIRTCKLLTD